MDLSALRQSAVIDRLLRLETEAHHLTAMAAVADACAYVAREKADTAQRSLSEIKVFIALLDDGATFDLRAPMPDADDPAQRLGVRLRPVPRPDREPTSCPAPPSPAPPSSATRPASRETMPRPTSAPGPALG
jgi:hypothetical protein